MGGNGEMVEWLGPCGVAFTQAEKYEDCEKGDDQPDAVDDGGIVGVDGG